jgi:hypothetical protein
MNIVALICTYLPWNPRKTHMFKTKYLNVCISKGNKLNFEIQIQTRWGTCAQCTVHGAGEVACYASCQSPCPCPQAQVGGTPHPHGRAHFLCQSAAPLCRIAASSPMLQPLCYISRHVGIRCSNPKNRPVDEHVRGARRNRAPKSQLSYVLSSGKISRQTFVPRNTKHDFHLFISFPISCRFLAHLNSALRQCMYAPAL